MKKIALFLPERVKIPLRSIRDFVLSIQYYGKRRWCPVCGKSSRKFRELRKNPRKDARCPHCGALERHRFVWLYFNQNTNLFDGRTKKMLHVAPEKCLEYQLKDKLGNSYFTADLFDRRAMLRMDVTNIPYPEESFDIIYCSHVLEHVQDDRIAMREFFRVLKKDGWAVLLVPVTADKTFEDPMILTPSERLIFFGQEDHVRRYGPDYVDRLREAGFQVAIIHVSEICNQEQALHMGLSATGNIYYCTKNGESDLLT